MNSHLSHILAVERSQDLHRAAARSRLGPREDSTNEPDRRRRPVARLRTRVARLTARFAETGS